MSLEDEARERLQREAATADELHRAGLDLVQLLLSHEVPSVPLQVKAARTDGWILSRFFASSSELIAYGVLKHVPAVNGVAITRDGRCYDYSLDREFDVRRCGVQLADQSLHNRRLISDATVAVLKGEFRHPDEPGATEFLRANMRRRMWRRIAFYVTASLLALCLLGCLTGYIRW